MPRSSIIKIVKHVDINANLRAVIIAVVVVLTVDVIRGEECGQEEFMKCAQQLEILQMPSELSLGAAKKEELEILCHELRKGVRCIQSYTRRCMDLQQRNQFNKLYHGINQFIRDLCTTGEFQDEYLQHAPCSNKAKKDFEICANQYKETMVYFKPYGNDEQQQNISINEQMRTLCCSINELADCSENAAHRVCDADAARFARKLVDKYTQSLNKLYCEGETYVCRKNAAATLMAPVVTVLQWTSILTCSVMLMQRTRKCFNFLQNI